LPDAASVNAIKCAESAVFVALTATSAAAPADNDPAFIHAKSVPSEDNTCPLVPKLSSPSFNFPSIVMSVTVIFGLPDNPAAVPEVF